MANEKTLNTRVLLKTDTLANWNSSTLGLKKGEIAIATVAATAGSGLTEPVCMIKVGEDGVKKFNELPWSFYAKASDVYAWAKESSIAYTVGGTGTDIIWDPSLNNNKGGLHFTKGTTFATKSELDAAIEQFTGGIGSITDSNTITTVELITTEGDAHKGQIKVSIQKTVDGENDGAATVTYIDVVTPTELSAELAKYVKSVTKGDDSITIAGNAQNPTVAVKLDPTEGNALRLVSGKGLSASNQTVRVGSVIFTPNADVNIVAGDNITVKGESAAKTITIAGKDWTKNITDAVNAVATAAMEFKGATSVIPTGSLRKGDTYKVSGSFTVPDTGDAEGKGFTAKVGDTIVYDGSKWYLIPSGDDIEDTWRPITGVDNDATLSFHFGSNITGAVANDGKVTFGHSPIATPVKSAGTGREYLTGITTDGMGHITGYTTSSESDQDLSGKADKVVPETPGNFAGLDENGNLIDSGKKAADFATATQGGKADTAVQTFSNNAADYITINAAPITIVNATDKLKNGIAAAETALQEIEPGIGLKVSPKANNKQTIDIDDAVTFIFDCGGAGV